MSDGAAKIMQESASASRFLRGCAPRLFELAHRLPFLAAGENWLGVGGHRQHTQTLPPQILNKLLQLLSLYSRQGRLVQGYHCGSPIRRSRSA
jgi:hypothetical protein